MAQLFSYCHSSPGGIQPGWGAETKRKPWWQVISRGRPWERSGNYRRHYRKQSIMRTTQIWTAEFSIISLQKTGKESWHCMCVSTVTKQVIRKVPIIVSYQFNTGARSFQKAFWSQGTLEESNIQNISKTRSHEPTYQFLPKTLCAIF